jgi:hypothetical protein
MATTEEIKNQLLTELKDQIISYLMTKIPMLIAGSTYTIIVLAAAALSAVTTLVVGFGGGTKFLVTSLVNLVFSNVIGPIADNVILNGKYILIDKESLAKLLKLQTASTHQEIVDAFNNLD